MTKSRGSCSALEISAPFDIIDGSLLKPCFFLKFLDTKMSFFFSSLGISSHPPLRTSFHSPAFPNIDAYQGVTHSLLILFYWLSLDHLSYSHCFYHYLTVICLYLKSVSRLNFSYWMSHKYLRSTCPKWNSYLSSTYSFPYIIHPNAWRGIMSKSKTAEPSSIPAPAQHALHLTRLSGVS